ncbi:MAG: TetR/AcrR family transcriptional regulator [Cytophagales bacterium]|nr:TetR/AcrR family transcriptional regulator [Cytophagales bacterium]
MQAVSRLMTPVHAARRGRPPKTLSQRDEGNRRRDLIQRAARLFREKGYAATSTRDIAASVGMHSGSPFYHFESKQFLLFTVMCDGMNQAKAKQSEVLAKMRLARVSPEQLLYGLIRHHLEILLGADKDFIPVMLYEYRSLDAGQQQVLADMQHDYEADWLPVLKKLHAQKRLHTSVKWARLLIFGALNWTVQWHTMREGVSQAKQLDTLARAALDLFIHPASPEVAAS